MRCCQSLGNMPDHKVVTTVISFTDTDYICAECIATELSKHIEDNYYYSGSYTIEDIKQEIWNLIKELQKEGKDDKSDHLHELDISITTFMFELQKRVLSKLTKVEVA